MDTRPTFSLTGDQLPAVAACYLLGLDAADIARLVASISPRQPTLAAVAAARLRADPHGLDGRAPGPLDALQ